MEYGFVCILICPLSIVGVEKIKVVVSILLLSSRRVSGGRKIHAWTAAAVYTPPRGRLFCMIYETHKYKIVKFIAKQRGIWYNECIE